MNSWRPYPLLRLVFPFAAGIIGEVILAGYVPDHSFLVAALLAVLFIVSLVLPLVLSNFRLGWITGLVFNLFLVTAGYQVANCHRPENAADFLGRHPDGFFIATITEPPTVSLSAVKAVLRARFRHDSARWVSAGGYAVCYLAVKRHAVPLQFGDHILVHAGFAAITDNSNPHTFNYPRYLKNKGISHRLYTESWCWQKIGLEPDGIVRRMAFMVRDRLLNILRANHVEGREFAVAAALLLGYVDELDPELRNDYAATGAMHVLSVSGMHVGIIYVFLEFLLGFLNKSRPGRLFKAILLLAFIWFYAMLTGLSPCVLRSAAMLSLPIIGKAMNRSPNMYNIIAASLIFILAMDPFLILDVGFQLSYLAVTGIIILYKPIYDWYVTSSWLPDKIWSILAVSIAAQVATLPITLYTFHQFPNYFMLTNLFVVPLSSFIIYAGIFVLVVGNIAVVGLLSAKVLIFLIWLLNSALHFIEQLPFSTIRGIFISTPEMLLLYVVIAALFLFIILRRISYLYLFLLAAIAFSSLILEARVDRLNSSRLIIFNASREALYAFSSHDNAIVLYNGQTRNGGVALKPNHSMVLADMNAHGVKYLREFRLGLRERPAEMAKDFVPVIAAGDFMQFASCRIRILESTIPKRIRSSVKVDLLILSGSPGIELANAVKLFHPGQIIIDATNSRYKTMRWLAEATRLGVKCHAVTLQGAYEKEF